MQSAGALQPRASSSVGPRAGLLLTSLILAAAVANLNLAVANVALPTIGASFDASQTALDLVAVGYSLGLAASVLYFGALGDRYGRKIMLMLGVTLSVPACLLAAYAPSIEILIAAHLLGGLSAGMAYPTTLVFIAALWSGPARTKSIALWSGIGGAISSLGPLISGWLLQHFWWGSVFLITLPRAAVALGMVLAFVPSHIHETTDPVDNLGGVLSVLFVAALVVAINFALTAGYAAAFGTAITNAPSAEKQRLTNSIARQLLKSFAGAVDIAHRYPEYSSQINAAAKSSFLSGDRAAFAAGIVAILLGAMPVFFLFPKKNDKERLLAEYHSQDTSRHTGRCSAGLSPAAVR